MAQMISWLVLAAIHALPAFALFRPALLTTLYGLQPSDPLFLLMHHRASLFLAVLAACVFAAFVPEGRRLATIVVAISMVGFLVLYWLGGSPGELRRIAIADLAGIPFLAYVAFTAWRATS